MYGSLAFVVDMLVLYESVCSLRIHLSVSKHLTVLNMTAIMPGSQWLSNGLSGAAQLNGIATKPAASHSAPVNGEHSKSQLTESNTEPTKSSDKPTLYILSEFHPGAVRHAEELFNCVHHTDPEAQNWRQRATAILVKDYPIREADLDAAPQLRAIGKQGVGVDQIDVAGATKRGVKVFNTPGVNASAVAEMVMGLTLNVARDISGLWYRQMALDEAIRKETCNGLILTGKTIGIIGMGNIGREVARMFMGAFKSKVVAFDPYVPEGAWGDIEHLRAYELDSLLAASDIVSIHVPLSPATTGLISMPQLRQMKRTAILINASRGGIVDEKDLCQALDERLIWGCGFDCHAKEPPSRKVYERLWSHEHYVGTPHVAAATDETQIATTNAAIDFVYNFVTSET
jgi:phosphoglycerate dehydrogenase-like enzyme